MHDFRRMRYCGLLREKIRKDLGIGSIIERLNLGPSLSDVCSNMNQIQHYLLDEDANKI